MWQVPKTRGYALSSTQRVKVSIVPIVVCMVGVRPSRTIPTSTWSKQVFNRWSGLLYEVDRGWTPRPNHVPQYSFRSGKRQSKETSSQGLESHTPL
jgi:hypothetical protein